MKLFARTCSVNEHQGGHLQARSVGPCGVHRLGHMPEQVDTAHAGTCRLCGKW